KGEKGARLRGVADRLDCVLKGQEILVRKNEPRKDPTKDPHVTNRNATILLAQALHLSDWIFGIPLGTKTEPETSETDEAIDEMEVDSEDEEYASSGSW